VAIVDGFAGRGRYKCGAPGSPLIFVEQIRRATEAINRKRPDEKVAPIEIDCLLILNDSDRDELENLKKIVTPVIL
jgi:three-Cys-motif partner protein